MRKILLVENRLERQKNYLEKENASALIDMQSDSFKIATQKDINTYIRSKEIPNDFLSCDLLMIHNSFALDMGIHSQIAGLPWQHGIDVVFFSGGISQAVYNWDISSNKALLYINSQEFYTKRLIEFINKYRDEDPTPNLQYLVDGDNWILSMLLDARCLIEYHGFKSFDNIENRALKDSLIIFNEEIRTIFDSPDNDISLDSTINHEQGFVSELTLDDSGKQRSNHNKDKSKEKQCLDKINRQIELILAKQ